MYKMYVLESSIGFSDTLIFQPASPAYHHLIQYCVSYDFWIGKGGHQANVLTHLRRDGFAQNLIRQSKCIKSQFLQKSAQPPLSSAVNCYARFLILALNCFCKKADTIFRQFYLESRFLNTFSIEL